MASGLLQSYSGSGNFARWPVYSLSGFFGSKPRLARKRRKCGGASTGICDLAPAPVNSFNTFTKYPARAPEFLSTRSTQVRGPKPAATACGVSTSARQSRQFDSTSFAIALFPMTTFTWAPPFSCRSHVCTYASLPYLLVSRFRNVSHAKPALRYVFHRAIADSGWRNVSTT